MLSRWLARHDMLRALRFPAYRWFMTGRFAAAMTIEMRAVAMGWIVYHLTGSALTLGWVSAAGSLATFVLAPLGGVLADRVEKRTILIWTRFVMVLTAAWIAALYYLGLLQAWHMAVLSLSNGMIFAFMMPAQETIPSDLVDRESLLNAISLGTVIEGSFGIIGAALAGLMLETVGAGGVFIALSLLFLSVCLTLLKLPQVGTRQRQAGESVASTMVEGVRYARRRPALLALLGLALAFSFFFHNYRTFLPAFAKDLLGLEASGLGLLTSAAGLGTLANSLFLASLGNTRHKGKLALGAGFVGALFLVLLVTLRVHLLAYLVVFVLGAVSNMERVMVTTMLQSHCEPAYRARVNSLSRTLGSASVIWMVPAGALVDRAGLPALMLLQAALLALIFGAVALLVPRVRTLH